MDSNRVGAVNTIKSRVSTESHVHATNAMDVLFFAVVRAVQLTESPSMIHPARTAGHPHTVAATHTHLLFASVCTALRWWA